MNTKLEEIFSTFPTINGGSFILREICLTDAKDFLEYMSHPDVKSFLSEEDSPTDIESSRSELLYWRSLFRSRRSIYWGIDARRKLIGTCGFNNWSHIHKKCEISYDLSREHWGRGIMTKVVGLLLDFAWNKMNVNRVQSTVAVNNLSSIRVLEKNNFICEGRLKKYGILNGEVRDYFMYSKTRNEK